MQPFDPLAFRLPELYAALQGDEADHDPAAAAWDREAHAYGAYFGARDWPPGVRRLAECTLHDARLVSAREQGGKLAVVVEQDNWGDDNCFYAVIEYALAPGTRVEGPDEWDGEWLYDQFADVGGGRYRHYVLFTGNAVARIDFVDARLTKFAMPPMTDAERAEVESIRARG